MVENSFAVLGSSEENGMGRYLERPSNSEFSVLIMVEEGQDYWQYPSP